MLLAKVLKNAWRKQCDDLSDVLDNVSEWCEDSEISTIEQHLEYLVRIKREVTDETGNYSTWSEKYLSEMVIKKFLMHVVDNYESVLHSAPVKAMQWRQMLRHLIHHSDVKRFSSEKYEESIRCILHYELKEKNVDHEEFECNDITSFIVYLDSVKEEFMLKIRSDDATVAVAKGINYLRQQFGNEQFYDDLFIVTLIFPFTRSPTERTVLKQLSLDDLEYLCKQLKEECVEFNQFKNMGDLHVQAYLFKLTVNTFQRKVKNLSKEQFIEHLRYIERILDDKIEGQIFSVLRLPDSSKTCDWGKIEGDLDFILKQKASLVVEPAGRKLHHILDDLSSIQSSLHLEDPGNQDSIEKSKINEVFAELDLLTRYHKKFDILDCMSIQSKELEVDYCTDPKLLPLLVLHKIMTYDLQCRKVLLRNNNPILHKSNDSDDSFSDDDTSHVDSANIPFSVHPQDGLLAVLCCADDFARQYLIARLVTCQFAVPLIIPEPFKNTLTVTLWGLRSIVKEWKTVKGVSIEYPLISYPMPIIVFIRFGRHNASKSKILNSIISQTSYDHFFHQDCEGGNLKCHLGNGLVDICWYLPAGKPNFDAFPDAVAFLNLHGDARKHHRQISFLCKISSMCFVLLNDNDIDDSGTRIIKLFSTSPGGIVLLRIAEGKLAQEKKQKLKEAIPNLSLVVQSTQLTKYADQVKTKITSKICDKWERLTTTQNLEQNIIYAVGKCDEASLKTDEGKYIAEAKKLASTFQEVLSRYLPENAKQESLPLQGRFHWQVWTKLEREQYEMSDCDIPTIEARKRSLRRQQLISARCLTPLMQTFLPSLLKCETNLRRYYLQFFKLHLDEYSKKHMRQLCSKHHEYIQQCKSSQEIREYKKKHSDDLNEASFGLEHVLREVGQVYEAANKSISSSYRLPQVAAELLIEGYPLELLDGDSAHVPLAWVNAVLDNTIRMLNDPKIFVLSVLGLQSSGKSTLLNATFGLQFAVSAGRCTRGAFMQLLPICDELKNKFDCKYLLVVDTEGLRAPESGLDPKHDNELATFVIGLANVTMINIYGEIPGDMDDILQTVIYAFIRMRRVRLKPSCLFVHQNVASISAFSKGDIGRHLFRDKLDKVTRLIAEAEGVAGEFTCFSDVIAFDTEKDVHHFPGLWNGEIPMAHYSQGYCDKAQALRDRILQLMSTKSNPFSLFKGRLEDLWKALLHENFILSFHNSLEAIAYKCLEVEYGKWTWEFQRKILKWNEQSKTEIKNSDVKDLPDISIKLEEDLVELADDIHNKLKKEVGNFFQENKYHSLLCHHEGFTHDRLTNLKEILLYRSKNQCKQAIQIRYRWISISEIKSKHDKRIKTQMANIAENLIQKHSTCTLQVLEEEFDKAWTIWLQEISNECQPVCQANVTVERAFKDALKDSFPMQTSVLQDKLQNGLDHWGITLSIYICKEKHFVITDDDTWWNTVRISAQHHKGPAAFYKDQLETVANRILHNMEVYVSVKAKEDEIFDPVFANEVIKRIKDEVEMMKGCNPKLMKHIKLNQDFIIDMSLIACGYASREFQKVEHELMKKYDVLKYFREKRKVYFIYFKTLHSRAAADAAAASSFCQLLSKPVKESVCLSLGQAIVSDMRSNCAFLQSKSALKTKILIDLAEDLVENHSFKKVEHYLSYPDGSTWYWLMKYTKDYCDESKELRDTKNMIYLATEELCDLLYFIRKRITRITNHIQSQECMINGNKWLIKICEDRELQRKLRLDFKECHHFIGFEKLHKDAFLEQVLQGLEALEHNILNEFETMTSKDIDALPEVPYFILYDSLKGCGETCPFCSEQCERGFQHDNLPHAITQHRPQCLGRYKLAKTNAMVLQTCNELIGTSSLFNNPDVRKPHRFRDYRKIYPNWFIEHDRSLEVSSYWKWLLGRYPEMISKTFNVEVAHIPPEWKDLNWKEVKKDLISKTFVNSL